MQPIAHIHNSFKEKFGVPRQSGLAPLQSSLIVFEEEFRNAEALRGIEDFDYIWLIWEFSHNGSRFQPTVRPPRLGGNKRMGIFATRSSFRPNSLGLSSVKLERVYTHPHYGHVIEVSGADMVDGTPIFDIKPYVAYCDSHPDAASGWVDDVQEKSLEVIWEGVDAPDCKEELEQILRLDPRPSYADDPDREYGFTYSNMNIRFKVDENRMTILSITYL